MALSEQRVRMQSRFEAQEEFDPYWRTEAREGRRISLRPVAFQCDDEVCVLTEDADKIRAGLKAFLAKASKYEKRAGVEPMVASALAKAARYSDTVGQIRVGTQAWNCLLFALNESGVDVVLTGGEE